ncbi:MAG: EamA family transporter, partial [Candidatus Lokiarchaeota archaeon]|nr:EamA family transporter [Candidatus Lokiarchaeota archaeon]
LWGTSFPAIKIGLEYVDAINFVFLRFLVASIVMFIAVLAARKFEFKFSNKKILIFLGLTNGVAYLLQYIGMNYTSAAKASLFVNLSAIWVALISTIVIGEHFGKNKTLGIISGVIGLFLVTTNLNIEMLSGGQILGDLILILAGIVWAFFIVYNKILVNNDNGLIQSIIWILPITLIPTIPFVLISPNNILLIPIEGWIAIFYTAVFCWVIPYYLWLEGLKHISASTSTILLLTEILVATTISVIFLNELITLITGIGALFILAALVIVSKQPNKQDSKKQEEK